MRSNICALLCLIGALPACGHLADEDVPVAGSTGAIVTGNGVTLNGSPIGPTGNGSALDGMWLNSATVEGLSLTGTALHLPASQGGTIIPLSNVTLDGSMLRGVREGTPISGAGLRFAWLQGRLQDGKKITMRIDAVQTAPPPNADVYLYQLRYWITGVSTAWVDLCPSAGSALAVPGRWIATQTDKAKYVDDSASMTFSCQNGAIAKCVMLGYKPWRTHTESTTLGVTPISQTFSLKHHHQACVRAIRADYCGNGDSNTRDGVQVDIFDYFDIAPRDLGWGWEWEAAWTTQGARFLYSPKGRTISTNPLQQVDMRAYVNATCLGKWNNVVWPQDPATADWTTLPAWTDSFQYGFNWVAESFIPMDTRVLLRNIH